MIKAVIFDMDGLILDSEIVESHSFEKILKEHGVEPKPNANGLIHEIGGADGSIYYEKFKNKYNLKIDAEVIQSKKRAYWRQTIQEGETTSFPGFLELIELLKKENFIIALASNRNEASVHLVLEKLGVNHYFHTVVGSAEGRKPKPSPDVYLHTAKLIGVKPSECVVLEDTDVGIFSAKEAGMKAIAVPNKYTKSHNFERADVVVSSLKDVSLDLINNLV